MIAHRDPAAAAALAAAVANLTGMPPDLVTGDPGALGAALAGPGPCRVLLDVDLVPAVAMPLRESRHRVLAVTRLAADPRAAKLAQWGIVLVLQADLPAALPDWLLPGPYRPAEPAAVPPAPAGGPADAGAAVPVDPGGSRIVAVHSPKGGAGTSTVAAHLAVAWACQGRHVVLVDLAPYGATPVLCKAQQRGSGVEALVAGLEQGRVNPAQPDLDLGPYLTPLLAQPGRLDLLAGGRPRVVDRLTPEHVRALLDHLAGAGYDRVVVDTSAEPTARNLAALLAAAQVVLVATPDYTCCWNLLQLQEVLELLQPAASQVVVLNRDGPDAGMPAADLAARLKLPVVAALPEDVSVQRLGNRGVPWDLPGDSPFLAAVQELAGVLDCPQEALVDG